MLALTAGGLTGRTAATDTAATSLTPRFTTIVAIGGGLWPQIQVAPDGTLPAVDYNAAAHTTLPGDVDGWASADGRKLWSLRATAAARPAKSVNYCHWASGFSAKGDMLVLASGMDDDADERGRRAPNDVEVFRSADFGKDVGKVHRVSYEGRQCAEAVSLRQHPDGSPHTVVDTADEKRANAEAAWRLTSRDDGRSCDKRGSRRRNQRNRAAPARARASTRRRFRPEQTRVRARQAACRKRAQGLQTAAAASARFKMKDSSCPSPYLTQHL